MNGYGAQDMATQGAEGFRNGYQVGYADAVKAVEVGKPAAAQEAVAYLDIGAGGYLDLGSYLPEEQLLALPKGRHALGIIGTYGIDGYASAPVTAAPAVAYMIDGRTEQGLTFDKAAAETMALANGGTVRALGFVDGTPAAPGIDLEPFRRLVEWNYDSEFSAYENGFRTEEQREVAEAERKRLLALIDASPKGERVSNPDELAFAARGFLSASFMPSAEESTREMRDTYSYWHRRLLRAAGGAMDYEQATDTAADSPKGGSEARDAALNTLAIMFHNSEEMEGPDGMAVSIDLALWHEALEAYEVLIGDYDEVTLATSAQAQAGDAEVQP